MLCILQECHQSIFGFGLSLALHPKLELSWQMIVVELVVAYSETSYIEVNERSDRLQDTFLQVFAEPNDMVPIFICTISIQLNGLERVILVQKRLRMLRQTQ